MVGTATIADELRRRGVHRLRTYAVVANGLLSAGADGYDEEAELIVMAAESDEED